METARALPNPGCPGARKTSSLPWDTWAEQGGGRQLSINSLCCRVGASIEVKDALHSWNIPSPWPPLKPGNTATFAPPSLAVPGPRWPPPRFGATNSHFWSQKRGKEKKRKQDVERSSVLAKVKWHIHGGAGIWAQEWLFSTPELKHPDHPAASETTPPLWNVWKFAGIFPDFYRDFFCCCSTLGSQLFAKIKLLRCFCLFKASRTDTWTKPVSESQLQWGGFDLATAGWKQETQTEIQLSPSSTAHSTQSPWHHPQLLHMLWKVLVSGELDCSLIPPNKLSSIFCNNCFTPYFQRKINKKIFTGALLHQCYQALLQLAIHISGGWWQFAQLSICTSPYFPSLSPLCLWDTHSPSILKARQNPLLSILSTHSWWMCHR